MTLWEEVDERALRWVFSLPPSFEMQVFDFATRDPRPFEPVAGLDTKTVTEALGRLYGYGLIDGKSQGWMGGEHWHSLRVTSLGLIYLGEWPDLDLVATASALHHLLRAVAEDAPEEEQKSALKRAAGVLSRTADTVVRDTLSEVAHSGGTETTKG